MQGQGIYNLATKSQDLEVVEEIGLENERIIWVNKVMYIPPNSNSRYANMEHFLHHKFSSCHLNSKGRRNLRLEFAWYHLVNGIKKKTMMLFS